MARYIVFGAGAIGGVVGARLFQSGHDVVLVARGTHGATIASRGLCIETAEERTTLRVPVVAAVDQLAIAADDAVLFATKSQDTAGALAALERVAPRATAIACLQNGVANERLAAEHFANVYAVCVMCPATYLEPGVVQANSVPITGILDVGQYPSGVDERARAIAAAFTASTFVSEPRSDIMRWKYRKLMMNLANAIQAVCGTDREALPLVELVREEGERCLVAAGIDVASESEDRERRADLLQIRAIEGQSRGGGSSWQSLERGAGTIESEFLNGEISRLGRLHGVATPVNDLLVELATTCARERRRPGSISVTEFRRRLNG